MFGCIYQLWDWLEAPPLFSAATMDAKKLQQLQQSQNVQKKIPLAYQTNIADYRTATHSPVFQQQHQHQQQQHGNYHMTSHMNSGVGGHYQQSPTTTSSSGGGPLSPIDIQPQASKLLLKHQLQNSGSGGSSIQSSPYHQASISSGYPTSSGGGTDQLYQSPPERTYLQAAGRLGSSNSSALALQQQYQQIQQAKLQAQIASQNEAIQQQQQRNFAMRQAMNAAAPQGHYHMSQQQQQGQGPPQQHQQRAPPSSLNLTNQFQPASGPLKVNQQNSQKSSQQHYHQQQQQEQIYGHHQQQQQQQQHQQQMQHLQMQQQQQQQQHHAHALQHRSKSDLQQTPVSNDQSPIYIQQNHPGHVVNQAVQTQISTVAKATTITKTPSSEDSSSASAKSPTHAPLDRKKSAGSSNSNAQALKSPITKRPPNSPVTISGWLYKQGSDGLKVWRKRWFVLAEYCLYYYKSPDEEKVLGSILLPSYKVSACLPEDKIYRKFAFKCEHQNMRTYWLAAENAESMVQWVRALSAATLMQATHGSAGDSSEHPSGSSSVNHSGENSDSGINTLQSKMSGQGQVTPASDNGGGVTASSSNSGGGAQPLYANAPPKPRRITDGGYSSPSPEHSVDNERTRSSQQQTSRRSGIMSPSLQQMQQQQYQQQQQQRSQHHAIYDTRTGNVSSAIRVPQQQSNYNLDNLESQYQQQLTLSPEEYPSSPLGSPSQYMDAQMEQQIMQLQQQRMAVDDIYGERELYMQRLIQQRYPPNMAAYGAAAERRTPDAYGRSKNRLFSDYEDIYNLTAAETAAQAVLLQEAAAYRRPLSPPSYEDNKYMPTVPSRYTPNHLELTAAGSNLNLRTRPAAASMIRPHSADFLEYEARAEAASDAAAVAAATAMIKPDPVRAPRPKSSLDINRTPDSFYYSEENYAEKMRKSALYLQNPQAQPQAAAGSYRMATGSSDFLSPVASGMNTIAYENPYERIYKRNELLQDALGNQAGHTSIPRMSRSQTMGGGAQIRSSSTHPHHPLSPTMGTYQPPQQPAPPLHTPLLSSGLTTQEIIQQNEQFLRSASARLPKRSSTFDDEPLSANTTNTTPTSPPPPTGTTTGSSASGAGTTSGSAANSSSAATTAHLEGERKREESMKRLLEWKQRMLQSPLTRKSAQHVSNSASAATQIGQKTNGSNGGQSSSSSSSTTITAKNNGNGSSNLTVMKKLGSNPNIMLTSTNSGQKGNATNGTTGGGIIQRRRSESQAITSGPTTAAGYNSYSSDDEAGTITKAPAGRSSLRVPTPNNSHNNNNKNNNQTKNNTTNTNTILKHTQVSKANATTSLPGGAGPETFESHSSNDNDAIAIAKAKSKTISINDRPIEELQQQQQQLDYDHQQGHTGPMTSSHSLSQIGQKTDTETAIGKPKSILKPILKTKIINVKPVVYVETSDAGNTDIGRTEELTKTNISLPKIPNAIEVSGKTEPVSPPISSYVPVYNTKTLTPAKSRSLSTSGYECIEIQPLESVEKSEEISVDSDQIKSETEAIYDAEATPMLMGLKRFKEKEEQRLQFQLNLEKDKQQMFGDEEDESKTPTQEQEDSHILSETNAEMTGDVSQPPTQTNYEDNEEEDTTCEYTDDDLDEALAEDADVEEGSTMNISQSMEGEEELSQIYENEPLTPLENRMSLDESHYLPMTPKKIETDSETTGNISMVSMLDSTNEETDRNLEREEEEEENHYVEMTKQLQEDDSKSNYEIMCIGQGVATTTGGSNGGAKPKQPKTTPNEPLYMELQAAKSNSKIFSKSSKEEVIPPPSKTSTLKKLKKSTDTLKKKSKKSQQERAHQKRKDLPDILKPSQSSMALNSDSSDADDESSKHMDSKKMRSRSRFSLSDTFRPASYYLGASTPLNNCIESSDSEIVSPPPIPNSPPPMEELKTTEEIFSSENYDTVKRRDSSSGSKLDISYEQLPKIHASNTSLNLPKSEITLKSSRLSLPDHFRKVKNLKSPHLHLLKQHERTLSDSNYSFQTDNSSNTSSDFDLYNKLKQNSPSFIATPIRYQSNSSLTQNSRSSLPGTGNSSETDTVELRHRQGSDSELDRQRSRRPLSQESISEIESLSEKFEDALDTADLDSYLNNLQSNDIYAYHNVKFNNSTSNLLTDAAAAQGAGILTNLIKPPKIFRNHEDEHFYGNINFVSSTDSLQKMGSSDAMGASSLTPVRYMTPLHSRNNSNISEQSAPYYYSELANSRELLSTPTTLNNQRDIHAHGLNIDHIHNPIERASTTTTTQHTINMDLLADKDQAIDSKNLYKMKTNIEKLSYSSSKNLKSGEPFQHHNSSTPQTFHLQQLQSPALKINNYQTNNLLYQQQQTFHTTVMTSVTTSTTSPTSSSSTTSSSSSQAMSMLTASVALMVPGKMSSKVDVNAKNINLQMGNNNALVQCPSRVNAITTTPTTTKMIPKSSNNNNNNVEKSTVLGNNPLGGELLWEEDTLWRESLRRVSQRHARSLDDLDRIVVSPRLNTTIVLATPGANNSASPNSKKSPDYESQESPNRKHRLSRDVTYVNDNVSQHLRSSFKLRHHNRQEQEDTEEDNQRTYDEVCPDDLDHSLNNDNLPRIAATNDHDVYVQLNENILAVSGGGDDLTGEMYEVLRDETASNISSNKSAEIDRETIRQWDSMSSGLMKNSLSTTASNETASSSPSNNVKAIIDQLNANCDNNNDNTSVIIMSSNNNK